MRPGAVRSLYGHRQGPGGTLLCDHCEVGGGVRYHHARRIGNPREAASYPAGFRQRYLRRIDKQRVWVVIENDRLVFKTDVIADTPRASYIEGVYVRPDERGKGVGRRCLLGVTRFLMKQSKAIYLFVEDQNTRTKLFYLNAGFNVAGQYDLLYF